jgi:hypothetical protein
MKNGNEVPIANQELLRGITSKLNSRLHYKKYFLIKSVNCYCNHPERG